MKVAIPLKANNQVDDHFGHCAFYSIYAIYENGEIKEEAIIEADQGCGCKSNIASVLADAGVKVMLAGGIGAGAINVLNNTGINVIRGCSGDVTTLVKQYASGELTDSGVSCASHDAHHGEEGGHQCSHNH
jgi:predicted Fe-Mo cluster-binding NifX family protein